MIKRALAFFTASVMAVTLLASCGDGEGTAQTKGTGAATGTADVKLAPETAEIDRYISDLADTYSFSGKQFVYIGGGMESPSKEEETGDIASDALYYRQREIEEKLHIDWVNQTAENNSGDGVHPTIDNVLRDVMAGTSAYDAGYGTAMGVVQPLLMYNAISDISSYSVVDLEREWWPAKLRDTYMIGDAVYFLNGPIVSSNYLDTYCVMFNKDVVENYGIENLYDCVSRGEWTFDKMMEVAEVISANANGSGTYRYARPHGIATIYAAGLEITKFDETGNPFIEEKLTMELSNLADKMSAVFGDDTVTVNSKGELTAKPQDLNEKYGFDSYTDAFVQDKVLFLFGQTRDASELRSEEVTFGILPMPKGDAAQENYISYAGSSYNVFVPKSTKDHAVTDVILEAMAALGQKYLKPAYYDSILKSRSTYDYESQDMIDLVFETKVYDLIDFLAVGGSQNDDSALVNTLKAAIQETSDGVASRYQMQAKIVNRNITSLLSQIEKNGID